MLGDAHAVAEDDPVALPVGFRHALDRGAGEAGAADDLVPAGRLDIGAQFVDTDGVLGDEGAIGQPFPARIHVFRVGLEQRLHHALQPCPSASRRRRGSVALIDCLTLWRSNLMLNGHEVGFGLVPETPLGRAVRDEAGRLNQRVAAAADGMHFVAAGLELRMK